MSRPALDNSVMAATSMVALLEAQADGLRKDIARLRVELARLNQDFDTRNALLLAANEQLVLAALRAESVAEAAVSGLGELARVSQRDPLTDTPNRALMLDRLGSALAMAQRRGTRAAVLFVDMDRFKQVNDTCGHAIGDAVLQLMARRLEAAVRQSDTVSRHGGDEFLVLLAEITQASDAVHITEKMLAALAAPCPFGEHLVQLSGSIGIAVYPEDGVDAATLIGHADAAMYHAKQGRLGSYRFHGDQS